ncbi:MAG: adenine phosphoribosyltransferase [Polyangiaceae bacterium]|jgi:adenine phosphoribosyltransferase|nr:adenine phosphoribosyltransferase [Polyangiaceae bacterium]
MAARKRSAQKPKARREARAKLTPRGGPKKPAKKPARHHLPHIAPELVDGHSYVRKLIREIPNFPQPGILFKDITPLLADPKAFHIVLDAIAERFMGEHIDAVVGIESRGFIFGGALAARLNASFVPVRKPGKLPYRTDKVSYSLEYGESELEMHRDSLSEGARVLVVDDLLATGGTAAAAGELVHRQGAYVAAYAFVVELRSLGGRDRLVPTPVIAFLQYD